MYRPVIALVGLTMLAACSGTQEQALLAPDESAVNAATGIGNQAIVNVYEPMPGARRPVSDQPGVATLNSDNQPTVTRTGLNGDPANPNGAPGRPQNWDSL